MKKTFEEFDKLNRIKFAERLTKAISIDYEFAEGSYVVSLNSGFGTGKTTFLEMWKNYLEQEGYKTILINAWETDFADDPIIPIISSLLEFLENDHSTQKEIITNTKRILIKALGALGLTSFQVLKKVTGIDLVDTVEKLEQWDEEEILQKHGNRLFEDFSSKLAALGGLKAGLAEYLNKLNKKPLLILVDELDRARPNYSVEFLEAIKHIFAIKGIAFILAVDKKHLKSAMQVIYGQGLEFDGYYRRFALREATLPSFYSTNDFDNNNALVGKFIDKVFNENILPKIDKKIVCFPLNIDEVKDFFKTTAILFSLTLREIEYCFRTLTQFLQTNTTNKKIIKFRLEAAIFLIVLSVKDENIYHDFCNDNITPEKFYDYFKSRECFSLDISAISHLFLTVFLSNVNQDNLDSYFSFMNSISVINFRSILGDGHTNEINRRAVFRNYLTEVYGHSYRPERNSINYSIYQLLESWRNIFDRE